MGADAVDEGHEVTILTILPFRGMERLSVEDQFARPMRRRASVR